MEGLERPPAPSHTPGASGVVSSAPLGLSLKAVLVGVLLLWTALLAAYFSGNVFGGSASEGSGDRLVADAVKRLAEVVESRKGAPLLVPSFSAASSAAEKRSWVTCSEGGGSDDRQCTLHHFCLSRASFGRLFPEHPLRLTPDQTRDEARVTAQLSSYIEEGGQIFETFRRDQPADLAGLVRVARKVLVVYAPAAWPDKFPAHAINNNFVPLLRTLENGEPKRRYRHMWEGHVWRYGFDMVLRCCGFAAGPLSPERRGLFEWMGVRREDVWTKAEEFPSDQMRCYERVHLGVQGNKGNWKKMAFDGRLWETLRLSTLAHCDGATDAKSGECKGSCWPPVPQETLERPEVMLVQRDDKQGNVAAYGDRVFRNINELDAELKKLKEAGLIEYRGVQEFSGSMSVHQQACRASAVGIVVAIHGNALSLAAYMQPQTIMIEVGPQPPYYNWVATALRMHFVQLAVKDRTRPELPVFVEAIKNAVRVWKIRFKRVND